MQKEREPISKKIRPPKANTWAGEDGRAKGEVGTATITQSRNISINQTSELGWSKVRMFVGWLHTSQWLRKKILVYNIFSLVFFCLAEDACGIGRGTNITNKIKSKSSCFGR